MQQVQADLSRQAMPNLRALRYIKTGGKTSRRGAATIEIIKLQLSLKYTSVCCAERKVKRLFLGQCRNSGLYEVNLSARPLGFGLGDPRSLKLNWLKGKFKNIAEILTNKQTLKRPRQNLKIRR